MPGLTDKQIGDLNKMNVAAQRATLGTWMNVKDEDLHNLDDAVTTLSETMETVLKTPATAMADSTATTIELLVADFNTLLAKLRTAGLMAEEEEE